MAKEIERKFLVKKLPDNLKQYPFEKIRQGYIYINPDGSEERLRSKGGRLYRTHKSGGFEIREEKEIEISKKEFEADWPKTANRVIEKTRYYIPFKNIKIELDIYIGKLDGLVVVEVEFDSEEQSRSFNPPDWFDMEVTNDANFKNKNLSIIINN